jgi:hypothetical protein
VKKLTHKFVEFIPDTLDDGILYVSIAFGTVAHRCCCGCKREVVTPLTPTDWKLTFDGETVSLRPSIGNWNFPCRSHYWITKNRIEWAPSYGHEASRIDDVNANDNIHSNAISNSGRWREIKKRWCRWKSD